jgi:hypothetical protein
MPAACTEQVESVLKLGPNHGVVAGTDAEQQRQGPKGRQTSRSALPVRCADDIPDDGILGGREPRAGRSRVRMRDLE